MLSDEPIDALNYKTITKQMLYHVERGRFKLLEKRTAELVMIAIEPEQVSYAKVRVDKPHALRFADSVSLTLSAARRQAADPVIRQTVDSD